MRLRLSMVAGLAAVLRFATAAHAEDPGPLPPFQPPPNVTRTIRIWGNPALQAVAENWARGFRAAHPDITFEIHLVADGTGMPALYTGRADIALFGRDTTVTDNDGFEHVLNYKHLAVELGSGSADAPGRSPAPVVFVHPDNPLARLTLAQLDAIFGPERRRGAPRPLRTWGDLGLTGEWRDQPIRIYAEDIRTGPGQFFQRVVLKGSNQRNWEHFIEFRDRKNADGSVDTSSRQSLAALRADRYGLAVAYLSDADTGVKPLALAAQDGETFYAPTRENFVARTYPLTRPIFACVNRAPGRPLDPKVADFLRYVLGPAGQDGLGRAGDFLPLGATLIPREIAKLE